MRMAQKLPRPQNIGMCHGGYFFRGKQGRRFGRVANGVVEPEFKSEHSEGPCSSQELRSGLRWGHQGLGG